MINSIRSVAHNFQNKLRRSKKRRNQENFISQYSITQTVDSVFLLQYGLDLGCNEPIIIKNKLNRYVPFEEMNFCADANIILSSPNAGGSSINSEAVSFDILHTLINAELQATETELEYVPGSKITDFSVSVKGETYGVSVTRAMKYRGLFSNEDAVRLLTKKLNGVNESSRNVLPQFAWKKQILHILAEDERTADIVCRCYDTLPIELRSNTVVIVTVVEDAPWVFYQRKQK